MIALKAVLRYLFLVNCVYIFEARHVQFYLNGYECFYEDILAGTKASIEYAPITGSKPHVDCTLEDPSRFVFYRASQKDYDYFKFVANVTGTYRVCFSNIYDFMMYSNVVYLDFVVGDENTMKMQSETDDSVKPAGALTQVETSMVNIHDAMRVVELYQNHHRIREANGRLVAQSLNEKILWWSMGQTMIFVIVAICQVVVLRRFFTVRKEDL